MKTYHIQGKPSGCCYIVHFITFLCLLDVVSTFGCLAMYPKNVIFLLLQGFHIMIAFGLFGFSFEHSKKGIWKCVCFLTMDIVTNTVVLTFIIVLYTMNEGKWSKLDEIRAIFLITRYSFFYLVYGSLSYLFYKVLKKPNKENDSKQELDVFDLETMRKVKIDLRSNRTHSLF
ncbi:hypothetical protein FO519_003082 [Halicephalobus sp. NKZ332]|nr:hypothetical protein FO519_003082 [Halicephalobus sp. NKZ332]